ncbi:MAG: hypothetical protein JXR05_15770 [Flavobacteriaceae bacterium]
MKFLFYGALVLFFASCNQSKEDSKQVAEKSGSSIVQKHIPILKVEIHALPKIEEWKEYELINDFIQQFTNISPNEALNNSRELNGLTLSLRDSIKPEFLDNPAFSARINLLLNETLRLYDLSSIPIIKPQEVNEQVEKVLNSFSSVNSKINTIIKQSNLENEVVDVNFKRIQNIAPIDETPEVILPEKKKIQPIKKPKKAGFPTREELMKKKKGTLKRPKKSKNDRKKTKN